MSDMNQCLKSTIFRLFFMRKNKPSIIRFDFILFPYDNNPNLSTLTKNLGNHSVALSLSPCGTGGLLLILIRLPESYFLVQKELALIFQIFCGAIQTRDSLCI